MSRPRDFDVLIELGKRTPIAVIGFLVFIIGVAGQVPIFNFLVAELPWRILSAVTGFGLMVWQAYLLYDAQRLPETELPTNQSADNVINRIILLSSRTQKTELIGRPDGLELRFDDEKNPSNSRRYLLSINELKAIRGTHKVEVNEQAHRGEKYGQVTIGRLRHWLYTREMHSNPDKLQKEIYSLIDNILHKQN